MWLRTKMVKSHQDKESKDSLPLVSIVIPTHNRKEKLIRLINSILRNDYPKDKLEIIVVDDASTDGTYDVIKNKFPFLKVIRTKRELLPAASRNLGIRYAKGDYIFLIDDDNVIASDTIINLVKTFLEYERKGVQLGVVAPIMYYLKHPKLIWCAGVKINMITSLTKFIGRGRIDNDSFKTLIESDSFPNAFMVKKSVIKKVKGFDHKNFPIFHEEADFLFRVRRRGYKVVCNPQAKIWHDVPVPTEVKDKALLFNVCNELRAYYTGRNRIIFHRRYSKLWQFLIFILIFNWLLTAYYLMIILFKSKKPYVERLRIAKSYLKGIIEGIR